MKHSIITFGCRVNQADSLRLEAELAARGSTPASAESADFVVVNTCSVTASADQGARQTIRRIAKANPSATIVATGCYATRCAEDLAGLPNVLRVIRNDDKERLLDLVSPVLASSSSGAPVARGLSLVTDGLPTGTRFGDGGGPCGAALAPGIAGRTAWTLRVQTGCDERCSYCIIPTTRGRGRSMPLSTVLDEVDRVLSAGFKEVAITGVHLGSYGRDLTPRSSLTALLEALAARSEDVLFRVSSLEPMDCTPAVVELVAASPRLAPHFHLPLQHASDRVLRAMRRPYTIADYRRLVDSIRERIPHAAIGSDVIVGFPGERDEDFAELETYLESSPLTHLHVFPYSDRPGTEAASMTDRAAGTVVRARGARVREIGATLARRFHLSQAGTVRRGLTIEDGTVAVTDNYLKVKNSGACTRNEWIEVTI